jgi:hypothetical protein
MDHVLAQHQDQVAFIEDQHTVQQFAAKVPMTRSQMASIRGALGKVVMIRAPSALNTSPNAVVNSRSRS